MQQRMHTKTVKFTIVKLKNEVFKTVIYRLSTSMIDCRLSAINHKIFLLSSVWKYNIIRYQNKNQRLSSKQNIHTYNINASKIFA